MAYPTQAQQTINSTIVAETPTRSTVIPETQSISKRKISVTEHATDHNSVKRTRNSQVPLLH